MNDIRSAIRSYLLLDPEISGVVGGARIYPTRMPQGETRPSVVLTRVSGLGVGDMSGDTGLSRPRMQIDCWSLSSDVAGSLANLVKERISGFRGQISYGSNSPLSSIIVQGVFFESERDIYESDTLLYGMSRDYFVWYEEK